MDASIDMTGDSAMLLHVLHRFEKKKPLRFVISQDHSSIESFQRCLEDISHLKNSKFSLVKCRLKLSQHRKVQRFLFSEGLENVALATKCGD